MILESNTFLHYSRTLNSIIIHNGIYFQPLFYDSVFILSINKFTYHENGKQFDLLENVINL